MKKCGGCGKPMKKCMCAKKSLTTEAKLLKALDALEKGAIPKEMRDADGGFATEGDGDELQVSASEGEPKKTKKSQAEVSQDEESVEKAESSSEESSDEEHSPAETSSPELSEDSAEESMEMSRKAKKAAKKSTKKSVQEPERRVSKSIKKSMVEDEANREVVEASSFLESLVDAVSDSNEALGKSLNGLASRVQKSEARQHGFNDMLAKAIIHQGNLSLEIAKSLKKLRKSMANIPDTSAHRTKLTKSEVVEREFDNGAAGDALDVEGYRSTLDQLVNLAEKGHCPAAVVSDFELNKSMDVIPEDIRSKLTGGLH